jgi:di/tricarboxylate transporter
VGITLAALADGLASGSPAGGPGDLLFSVAIYFACSLAFTFVLGLPGWALLRLFGCTTYLAYALVGTGLGALAGGWLIEFTPANPLLFVFGLAGLLAALAFRWVYGDDRRAASAA